MGVVAASGCEKYQKYLGRLAACVRCRYQPPRPALFNGLQERGGIVSINTTRNEINLLHPSEFVAKTRLFIEAFKPGS